MDAGRSGEVVGRVHIVHLVQDLVDLDHVPTVASVFQGGDAES